MVRIVSLAVMLTLIVVLGIVFFKVVAPFVLPLFLAGVAALLCQPAYGKLVASVKGRGRLAAGLMTGGVMLVILVPTVVLITIASLHLFSSGSAMEVGRVGRQAKQAIDVLVHRAAVTLVDVQDIEWLPYGLKMRVDPETFESIDSINELLAVDDIDLGDANFVRDEPVEGQGGDGANPAIELLPEADTSPSGGDAVDDRPERAADELANETEAVESNASTVEPAVPLPVPPGQVAGALADPVAAFEALPRERQITLVESEIREKGKLAMAEVGERSLGVAGRAVGDTLGLLTSGLGAFLGAVLALAMFAIGLYYFLADGPAMVRSVQKLVPVQVEYQQQLLTQFSDVVRSVVVATFAAALVQAVLCTIALGFCGIPHLIILFVLALIASMIPLAGTWLVWAPVALYLFIEGRIFAGTMLSIWGIAVIGVMDNVVRTYVLGAQTRLHPLLAFVSVLGGLQVMGLWGIFVGPIVASCLHALVEIFNQELVEFSNERFGEDPRRLETTAAAAGASADPPASSVPPSETTPAVPPATA